MTRQIILAPQAVDDERLLRAHDRAMIRDRIQKHLRHDPTKESKSRIKRLRGLEQPQYRLRVDEFRVFYDVTDTTVEVLAIVSKRDAAVWLARHGKPSN